MKTDRQYTLHNCHYCTKIAYREFTIRRLFQVAEVKTNTVDTTLASHTRRGALTCVEWQRRIHLPTAPRHQEDLKSTTDKDKTLKQTK